MTESAPAVLIRQNAYLKQRCAQLEADATDMQAQINRLTQQLERAGERRAGGRPNPLSGGQTP
jgi:hypothetical protein